MAQWCPGGKAYFQFRPPYRFFWIAFSRPRSSFISINCHVYIFPINYFVKVHYLLCLLLWYCILNDVEDHKYAGPEGRQYPLKKMNISYFMEPITQYFLRRFVERDSPRCPTKRMVLITCFRKVMRLKSPGLIDYHVKIEFLRFNLLSSSFVNKFDRIICISLEHTYLCHFNYLLQLPQNNTYFNDCKMLSKCWGI